MYYHVSDADLGPKVCLQARIPESRASGECAETDRVCFAPTVHQCLMAKAGLDYPFGGMIDLLDLIGFTKVGRPFELPTVYGTRTTKLVTPTKRQVPDAHKTGELWALKDIQVTRLGYIDVVKLITTESWSRFIKKDKWVPINAKVGMITVNKELKDLAKGASCALSWARYFI